MRLVKFRSLIGNCLASQFPITSSKLGGSQAAICGQGGQAPSGRTTKTQRKSQKKAVGDSDDDVDVMLMKTTPAMTTNMATRGDDDADGAEDDRVIISTRQQQCAPKGNKGSRV